MNYDMKQILKTQDTEALKLALTGGLNIADIDFLRFLASEEAINLEFMQLLFDKGIDINYQNEDGWTALLIASLQGKKEIINRLIENNVDVNLQHKDGSTALIDASEKGHAEIVKLLLENGSDVNIQDEDGRTALSYASIYGHTKIVKLLLENNVNVNIQNENGSTALHAASLQGHTDIVKLLIKNGADVNYQYKDGWTALTLASAGGYTEIVKIFLENNADVNIYEKHGFAALDFATSSGYFEIVKFLVENGAELNHQSKDGATALYTASLQGHIDIVKLLLEKGADANYQKENGLTALLSASIFGYDEIVEVLLKNDADVNLNYPYEDKSTALILASSKGHKKIVQLLIEHGAEINIKNNNGMTALMSASFNGHDKVVQLLIEHGADINIKSNNGMTALMFASFDGCDKVVQLLIDNGSDVNYQNSDGTTALMVATQQDNLNIVQLLVKNKADVNLTEKQELTSLRNIFPFWVSTIIYFHKPSNALSVAVDKNAVGIVKYLLEHGAKVHKRLLTKSVKNNNVEITKLLVHKDLSVNEIGFKDIYNNWTIDNEILKFLIDNGLIINRYLFLNIGKNIETKKILINNTKDKKLLSQYAALSNNDVETLKVLKELNVENRRADFFTWIAKFYYFIETFSDKSLIRRIIRSTKNKDIQEDILKIFRNNISLPEIVNDNLPIDVVEKYIKNNPEELIKKGQIALSKAKDQEMINLLSKHLERKELYGPEQLSNALKNFSLDDKLRYTNHPLDNDSLTYEHFMNDLKEGWQEIEADIEAVSPSLHQEISSLLFSENEDVMGWSSKAIKEDFIDGKFSSNNINNLQNTLKKLIVVKPDDESKLLKKFTKIRKKLDLKVKINLDNLKETRINKFFTDTKKLENALTLIIKDINEHAEENKEIEVQVKEEKNMIDLHIIHKNSHSYKTVGELEDTIKKNGGNFKSIYGNLVSVCDWSVDTVCSDGNRYKIDYLYPEIDNNKPHHNQITDGKSKGFTHILRFYI